MISSSAHFLVGSRPSYFSARRVLETKVNAWLHDLGFVLDVVQNYYNTCETEKFKLVR